MGAEPQQQISKFAAWMQAFRLRTLPLAFSSILLGAFLAAANGVFDGIILTLSLLTTLFLQVLSNLANDYGDAKSGVDHAERQGPSRTVQAGLISIEAMKRGVIICSGLAFVSGLALTVYAFPSNWYLILIFVVLGVAAIAAAIKYTVGKRPYGYAGFGDLFVLIFFGYVGVLGTFYLYAGYLDASLWLPATSCGLFAVAVLNVNNIRDIESDKRTGKNSIPVRLGRSKAVIYHWLILVGGVAASIVFAITQNFSGWDWFFLLYVPLIIVNGRAVIVKKQAKDLDPFLKQMALTTLLSVVLLGMAMIW